MALRSSAKREIYHLSASDAAKLRQTIRKVEFLSMGYNGPPPKRIATPRLHSTRCDGCGASAAANQCPYCGSEKRLVVSAIPTSPPPPPRKRNVVTIGGYDSDAECIAILRKN